MDNLEIKYLCAIFNFGTVSEWGFYEPYLKNIPKPFDFYVSIHDTPDNTDEKISQYKEIFKTSLGLDQVTIIKVPNRGADCGAFLLVLDYLIKNNLQYKYLLKVHTKTTRSRVPTWRERLVGAILGNTDKAKNCLNILENEPTVGLVGDKSCLVGEHSRPFMISLIRDRVFSDFNAPEVHFIGGTMFFARLSIYVDQLKQVDLVHLVNTFPEGLIRSDGQDAHAVERLLGHIISRAGYTLKGV